MIQRIQSLFLLLVTALMVVLWLKPIGIFVGNFGIYQYALLQVSNCHPFLGIHFPLWIPTVLTVLTALISLVTLFLFKKRKLQVLMSIIGIALMVLFYCAILAYIFISNGHMNSVFHASYIMSLPGISMAMFLLAIIFIKKDEKLVKSTGRIR